MKSRNATEMKSSFHRISALGASLTLLVSCAGFAASKTVSPSPVPSVSATPSPSPAPSPSPSASPSGAGSKKPASTSGSTPGGFEGCDSPTPMNRLDRLAVLAKITLDTENELASEIELPTALTNPSTTPSSNSTNTSPTVAPTSPSATAETPTTNAATTQNAGGGISGSVSGTSSEKTPPAIDAERRVQFRERIGTFAAGSMPDTVPLVSMDRSCWASFYGAQQKLAEGDEIGALNEAKEWKDCLNAMFPDRVSMAQPYFSCFSLRSKQKIK